MRILTLNKRLLLLFTLTLISYNINAQEQNITVKQDPKFEQLLNEKRKINASITPDDTYKIQIFSGKIDEAKKILSSFKREFNNIDGTIIFQTPNYKVTVGNFKTRIAAERNLEEIRKSYNTVFLLKPSR